MPDNGILAELANVPWTWLGIRATGIVAWGWQRSTEQHWR